jgi:hypothetical protein
MKKLLITLLIVLALSSISPAKETTYIGGSVNDPCSWSNGVPKIEDQVTIPLPCTVGIEETLVANYLWIQTDANFTNWGGVFVNGVTETDSDIITHTSFSTLYAYGYGHIYNYGVFRVYKIRVSFTGDGGSSGSVVENFHGLCGDLNGDGYVNFEDFALFAEEWLETVYSPFYI